MMATLGYWVDQARAGQGIAPTAVAMATDHCFRTLGLHRMEINIRPENGPSLRVVEKLGFRDEGYRPRFLHINGEWADHRTFALDGRGSSRRPAQPMAAQSPGLTGAMPRLPAVINPVICHVARDTPRLMRRAADVILIRF